MAWILAFYGVLLVAFLLLAPPVQMWMLQRSQRRMQAQLDAIQKLMERIYPQARPPVSPAAPVAVPKIPDPEAGASTPPRTPPPSCASSAPGSSPSAAAPRVPSPAAQILRRIWQWILVGEEFRPAGVTFEYAVATTWLMRAGIVALVTCVGYFLKWSIDRDLLPPAARVIISILVGIGMLIGGILLTGRRWNILGQGLLGGGWAVLYFSMYAAGALYHLLPAGVVFGLMVLVTLAAGVLALRLNSMLVAILGLIGGYCTPLLLRTDHPHLGGLYAYLLLLCLGTALLTMRRPWRLLNYLAFIFTWLVFLGSMSVYQRAQYAWAMSFLSVFFVGQSLLIYIQSVRMGRTTTGLEIGHLLLNAGLYAGAGYGLTQAAWGRPYPALQTLGLAIFFMAQIAELLWRRRQDRPLMLSLMALAGFFAALTFPLAVAGASLTICWALWACMLLWLGTRLDSAFVRRGAYVLYLVVVGRLLLVDFERDFGGAPAQTVPLWLEQMARRLWTSGTVLLSLWGAFYLRRHRILGYGGLALAILYTTLETRRFLYVIAPGFVAGGTSVVWTVWAIGLLMSGIARDARSLRYAGLAGFTVVVGKVFLLDLAGMPMMYRVLAFMVVGVCLLLGAFAYLRAARQFKKR